MSVKAVSNRQKSELISSLIPRQLDQEKISILEKRIEELTTSNNELRNNAAKNERDTHDLVLYFQREIDVKDEIIARLNEELVRRDNQLKLEIEKMQKKFDEEIGSSKVNNELIISNMTKKIEALEAELSSVEIYRHERDVFDGKLQQLEKSIQEQRQQMFDSLDEQERKYLEEKAVLLKNLDDQKLVFREIALKEARLAMGEEAKKILSDNARMHEELKFHQTATTDLNTEKLSLNSQIKMAKRDLAIAQDKEIEYARQLHAKTKEIKTLREKIEQQEFQQSVYVEKFKHKTNEFKADIRKELEESSIDNSGLRRLLQIKNRELRHMKALSATILQQRTETEQFFLEALAEVKELIKQEHPAESPAKSSRKIRPGHGLPPITTHTGDSAKVTEFMSSDSVRSKHLE